MEFYRRLDDIRAEAQRSIISEWLRPLMFAAVWLVVYVAGLLVMNVLFVAAIPAAEQIWIDFMLDMLLLCAALWLACRYVFFANFEWRESWKLLPPLAIGRLAALLTPRLLNALGLSASVGRLFYPLGDWTLLMLVVPTALIWVLQAVQCHEYRDYLTDRVRPRYWVMLAVIPLAYMLRAVLTPHAAAALCRITGWSWPLAYEQTLPRLLDLAGMYLLLRLQEWSSVDCNELMAEKRKARQEEAMQKEREYILRLDVDVDRRLAESRKWWGVAEAAQAEQSPENNVSL